MTAIPLLRPPRKSAATAYLKHLQQKKEKREHVVVEERQKPLTTTTVSASYTPWITAPQPVAPPSRTKSGTSWTSTTSEESESENDACNDTNTSRSCTSQLGELSLGFEDCSGTSFGPPPPQRFSNGCNIFQPATAIPLVEEMSMALVPVPSRTSSREPLSVNTNEGDDADEYCSRDEQQEETISDLDRLLAETSARWSRSCQETHREFCRDASCDCKTQALIEKQAAEIEALRSQLQLQQAENNYQHHHQRHELDEPSREDILPVEQIECYHDSDDHISVTSGLTHVNESSKMGDDCSTSFSFVQQQRSFLTPLHRPDASVSGIDNVAVDCTTAIQQPPPFSTTLRAGLPLPPNHHATVYSNRSMIRNHVVHMVAADGVTTRTARYSGPLYRGKPQGAGSLKFENGDEYHGDLIQGVMNGRGTYTVAAVGTSPNRKPRVLKGTFENNLFLG